LLFGFDHVRRFRTNYALRHSIPPSMGSRGPGIETQLTVSK
jgi:hypothetical protein